MQDPKPTVYVAAFAQSLYHGPGILTLNQAGIMPCEMQTAIDAMRLCGRKGETDKIYPIWLPTFCLEGWEDMGRGTHIWVADDLETELTWVCSSVRYRFAKPAMRPGWCEIVLNDDGATILSAMYRETGRVVYRAKPPELPSTPDAIAAITELPATE